MSDGKTTVQRDRLTASDIDVEDRITDVDVTVRGGVLTIDAERGASSEANGRSEFTHGSFTAGYDKGILTVTVPLGEPETFQRLVAVESAG